MSAALEVNECRVVASRHGFDWWDTFRGAMEPRGRVRVIAASLGGDLVAVECDDVEHARWLAGRMAANGVPESALRVVTA